jgi:glycosyltransferase involved in cell wall biosynthesis
MFAPPGTYGPHVAASILPTHNPLARIVWEQAVAPFSYRRRLIDVAHGPVNVGPFLSGVPSVITLHDLAFLRFPHTFRRSKQLYLSGAARISCRRAAHVITPSEQTKSDAVEAFGLDPERVTVVPQGVDERYRRLPDVPMPIEEPYILYAGTIEPRKNLGLLLRAFRGLKELGYPHKLVLAGASGWLNEETYAAAREPEIASSVVMTGFVRDLLGWYNHADLFVYPSLYEGFGLPPLEAMACGTPVVLSSAESLREVAGDAALYVPANDEEGFVAAMCRVLDDRSVREDMIRRGLVRAALYTWDETARRTVAVFQSVHGTATRT